MKASYFTYFLLFCGISWLQGQSVSTETAYKRYVEISNIMASSFPEDEMKTFRRISFSEEQLQTYLSQHITRMDLLPKIKGRHIFVLNSYLHSGNWYYEIGFPQKSIESYTLFFEYYNAYENELTTVEKKPFIEMKSYSYGILAGNYAKQGELDRAAEAHLQNIAFTKSLNEIFYPSALNNYGLHFYRHTKQIDSAFYYFKKAYTVTKSEYPNHTLIGSIRDNIADVYVDKNDYKAAEPLYKVNFEFYKNALNEKTKQKDIPRLIKAGAQYTTTLVELNQLRKAKKVFEELSEIFEENRNTIKIIPSLQLEYLIAKAQLLKKEQNYKLAFNTINDVRALSDSLTAIDERNDINWRNELNNIILNNVAFNFELERIQKENEITSERQRFWLAGLILIAALTLLISLFLRRRQYLVLARNKQLLAEQQLENTNLKVERLNSEIKLKERDLSDFAINLTQNREWAKELETKVQEIRTANINELEGVLSDFEQEIQKKITFDDTSQEFLERLDDLSAGFYNKLKQGYPNLTKTEIRLCSLLRLKIDSGSIATIQNITLASLHTSRYRLRKKLNLQGDADLDAFIQNL